MHTHSDSSPAFKFTSIPAPIPALGVKNAASSYARSDAQSVFHTSKRKPDVEFDARNTAQKQELAQQLKEERTALNGTARDGDTEMANGTKGQPEASTSKHSPTAAEELKAAPNEPGSRTIVLQLGSSQARIGLASQSGPTCIPFVVARPSNRAQEFPPLHADLEDPALDSKIDTMRVELRSRMRSFKVCSKSQDSFFSRDTGLNHAFAAAWYHQWTGHGQGVQRCRHSRDFD